MTKKAKKKTVHWTKLPRAKLVSMVKRLELANAKLKTQLVEARHATDEAVLVAAVGAMQDEAALAEAFGVVHVKQNDASGAEVEIKDPAEQSGFTTDEAALAETFAWLVAPAKMPWE